jgi:serine/threonine protein kinase
MPLEKRANTEPIRGYRLLDKLGAGGFGEVWKCEAPGGIHKAIKFVFGNLESIDACARHAEEELRAFQHIKSIRHPFLLSIDRVESIDGELLIVTELADRNLHELWQKYVASGLPGIPRDELLGFLREAAEVLDLLNHKFDLQHLDIKPHNLFIVSNHIKVADFGLVNSLQGTRAGPELQLSQGAVTPLYAAPELFHGRLSRQCDQYSLAIVYQEMLTGKLPYAGKNMRQILLAHLQAEPDLSGLPDSDRTVVARALAKQPDDRFPSCLEFVRALQQNGAHASNTDTDPDLVTTPGPQSMPTVPMQPPTPAVPRAAKAPPTLPAGVFDGYRLLKCITNSELVEVWKAQDATGKKKRVQLLFGLAGSEQLLGETVQRLRSVQHPALFTPEIAVVERGRLLFVIDHYCDTLRDRFRQAQARKQPGVPRGELIEDLRAAAEVLDYVYQQHGVEHLGLNPHNLVLDNGWLQIAEFGYAQLLWLPAGQDVARRNARYAAPELFGGERRRGCDQYSLALIYAEMLTGVHPFRGASPQVYVPRGTAPDLARLSELDREVVARALRPNPQDRWASCTDMLLALEGTSSELNSLRGVDSFATLVENARDGKQRSVYTGVSPAALNQLIAEIISTAGGSDPVAPGPSACEGKDASTLKHAFQAGMPIGTARVKLEEYARELGAQVRRQGDDGCLLFLQLPASFWQQWLGRQPGLEIEVQLARVNPMSATPIEVSARVRSVACAAKQGRDLIEKTGLGLIDALQKQLLVHSEKRVQDRLLWPHALTVIPLAADGQREEPIVCRGKDISATGIGFYLPHELATADVLIELPNTPPITVPATLVRAKRCADEWYEVGAIFRVPALRKSVAEICI